ncbi:hypothetical protein CSKR_108274 [Clonorchis sinensis]|uniref:Uncharacterized protein n=1 Tax=Clonorchis sinensis TaxID=79923 RepID=A0A8T1MLX8_CLOSI|nr:hypothetical protein CSKR_108274 [Clonorchis sinensis]
MLVISAAPNGDPEKGYINKSPGCKTSNYPQQDLNKFSCQLEFAYTVQSLRSDIMVKIDTSEATLSGLEVVTGAIQTWCSRAKLFQLLTTTVNVTLVKVPRITFHVMLYWYDYRIPCEPIAIYILCWLGSKSTIKDSLRTWTMSFFCCYPVSQIRQGTSTVLIPEQDFIADWTRARPISNFCGLVTSSVNKITSQGLLGPSLEFADSLNVKRLSSSYSQLKGERTSRRSLFAEYSKTLRCLDGVVPLTVNDILPTTGCFRRALDPDRKPEISNRRAKFGITNHKSTARYYVACRFYTSARCCIGVVVLRHGIQTAVFLQCGRRIVLSSTGKRMVTILDLDDLSCHRRHIDQVEFNTSGQSVNGTPAVSNTNESFVDDLMVSEQNVSEEHTTFEESEVSIPRRSERLRSRPPLNYKHPHTHSSSSAGLFMDAGSQKKQFSKQIFGMCPQSLILGILDNVD